MSAVVLWQRRFGCLLSLLLSGLLVGMAQLALTQAAFAQGERAVVFPVVGEGLSLAQASVVQGLVADVLEGEGHAVQVIQRLVQGGNCDGYRCERERLIRYGAAFAVVPSVWRVGAGDDATVTYEVSFALVTTDAVYEGLSRFDGRALTDPDASIGDAVVHAQTVAYDAFRDALVELLDRRALGPGPWLTVTSDVPGAIVVVDGVPRGRVPALIRVDEGDRRVVVKSDEREIAMTVRIGPKGSMVEAQARFADQDVARRVADEASSGHGLQRRSHPRPEAGDAAAALRVQQQIPEPDPVRDVDVVTPAIRRAEGAASFLRWGVLAGALTLGAVLLAPPMMTMLAGSCDAPDVGQRCRTAKFGPLSALQATAGVLAVSGGTLFALQYSVPID